MAYVMMKTQFYKFTDCGYIRNLTCSKRCHT